MREYDNVKIIVNDMIRYGLTTIDFRRQHMLWEMSVDLYVLFSWVSSSQRP